MSASMRNDSVSSGHPRAEEPRRRAERLRKALQQGGVPQLLRRSANRLASPWLEFGSVTFFRRRLDGGPEVPRARPGLDIFEASLADVSLILEASDPRRTCRIVKDRRRRGA